MRIVYLCARVSWRGHAMCTMLACFGRHGNKQQERIEKHAHYFVFLAVQHGNATAPAWPVCTASLLLQGAWYWSSSCRCKGMHLCSLYHRICTAACTLRRVELHMSTPH
jgi:hypothetical protein